MNLDIPNLITAIMLILTVLIVIRDACDAPIETDDDEHNNTEHWYK